MELLEPWIPNVGAVGLLTVVAWMVFTGRLVPRRVVDDVREDAKDRVQESREEAKAWKDGYYIEQAGRIAQTAQMSELLEHSRTANHLLLSLQAIAAAERDRER